MMISMRVMMMMMMMSLRSQHGQCKVQEAVFSLFFTYHVCEALSRETIGGFDGRGRQRMSCDMDKT